MLNDAAMMSIPVWVLLAFALWTIAMLLSARICRTVVHVGFTETDTATAWRFALLLTRLLGKAGMSIIIFRAVV